MFDFHRRINKREQIVGWFSTTTPEGEYINDTTYLFNDFYSKQCRRPVIIVVDTSLSSQNFNIRAFQSKSLKLGSTNDAFANLFVELKVEQEMSEAEATSIYHMIHFQDKTPWESSEITSIIPSEQERVSQALEKLLHVIDAISIYIDRVVTNQIQPIPDIGMKISDILSSLQTISSDHIATVYRDKVQDSLMVSYLSTLTKAQVLLSQKLNSIL